ncbi:hypothetical protein J7T55_012485 [Diaporthe amygdali]|uniref:uncharacterized protein n=1 Tax=Phomopsis amygdali TaxID=1214568 RepID=UPI0022FEDCFD|nr:uncharacterized protein J7T55_012485 [Diaporthe amygdali]KAJ0124012.1 hypothetical protein J7T55_012485 [Diaporthe amygdali]
MTEYRFVMENVNMTMIDAMTIIFHEIEKSDVYWDMDHDVVETLITRLGSGSMIGRGELRELRQRHHRVPARDYKFATAYSWTRLPYEH